MVPSKANILMTRVAKEFCDLNDAAHGSDHMHDVVVKSYRIVAGNGLDADPTIVRLAALFHDTGRHIDVANHHIESAKIFNRCNRLYQFVSKEDAELVTQAIEDHRASNPSDPRNIYGKILSTADRTFDIDEVLKRTYTTTSHLNPNLTVDDIINMCGRHISDKYGQYGYAYKRVYFETVDLKQFKDSIVELINNPERFRDYILRVNNVEVSQQ